MAVNRSRLSTRPVASTAAPPAIISDRAAPMARGMARDHVGQLSVGQLFRARQQPQAADAATTTSITVPDRRAAIGPPASSPTASSGTR